MWAPPGVLASPSRVAGFQKGACQEQEFQETQAETAQSLEIRLYHVHWVLSTKNKLQSLPKFQERGLHTGVNAGRRGSLGGCLWGPATTFPHPIVELQII